MAKHVPIRLDGLDPREYEHPFDAKALNALQTIPVLHRVVHQYSKYFIERGAAIEFTGSNLRITAETYPEIYAHLESVCETLHLVDRPTLYVNWGYEINGFTMGVDQPMVVLPSGAIDLLDAAELCFLIGHEVGHIKSRHVLYQQLADHLGQLASEISEKTLGIGAFISEPVLLALRWWSRMSEFTADRAGLLACQDMNAAIRLMMKLAGLPLKCYRNMRVKAFVQQAMEFDQLDYDRLNKRWKLRMNAYSTHPWTVVRAAELIRWAEAGDYQQVLERKTQPVGTAVPTRASVHCPRCRHALAGGEAFCSNCGQQLGGGVAG